jgi:hypothetical protein
LGIREVLQAVRVASGLVGLHVGKTVEAPQGASDGSRAGFARIGRMVDVLHEASSQRTILQSETNGSPAVQGGGELSQNKSRRTAPLVDVESKKEI